MINKYFRNQQRVIRGQVLFVGQNNQSISRSYWKQMIYTPATWHTIWKRDERVHCFYKDWYTLDPKIFSMN